jgi:hypothetical protein
MEGDLMDTRMVPGTTSIGNADGPSEKIAPAGTVPPGSGDTSGHPIGRPGSNAEAVFRATPRLGAVDGFLTANGSRDSHAVTLSEGEVNRSPRAGTPYQRIGWDEIRRLVRNPSARRKGNARFVVLSTYVEHDGRSHQVQRERGVFGGLGVDIDSGDLSLEQLVATLRQAVGEVESIIYSSSSATPEARKWRILLPLAEAIPGAEFRDASLALYELLESAGIRCDPALARSAQPVYLPNVPPARRGADGRPLFYQSVELDGPRLRLDPGSVVGDALAALRQRLAEEERARQERAEQSRKKREAREQAGDRFDAVEHYNAHNTIAELFRRYRFERHPRHPNDWRSPHSTSGSFSTRDCGDHWVTVSSWAENHNVGRPSRNGHRWGTAFDLFVAFEHGGDRTAALIAYLREVRPAGGAPPVRVEVEPQPQEVVPIDQYRRDLVQSIADSVLDGRPGVKLLRAAPGVGKTYAVLRAVARKERGVVSVPGHELAGEVVEQLRAAGVDAAAYPKLSEETCGNFDEASRARSRGLSVGATVCPKCPLVKSCRESGYLAGVHAAENADHKVVTHARYSRSAVRLLEKAEYLVIEEDPTTALRPTFTATRGELRRMAALAGAYEHARRMVDILENRDQVVAEVEDFAAWRPVDQVGHDSGDTAPSNTPLLGRRQSGGFFGSLCRVAGHLLAELDQAMDDPTAKPIRRVDVPRVRNVPDNPEAAIWHALEMIDRVEDDATAGISDETWRLVLAAACGAGTIYIQVETDTRPNAAVPRSGYAVCIRETFLPMDRPVYINDGTSTVETIARLVSRPSMPAEQVLADGLVVDLTPTGSVPIIHASCVYPVDILPTTATSKVLEVLVGIARSRSEKRLGVLLHQRHYRELIEAEDSPLPADVRERIVWATYFLSGADRGTNSLHKEADLAIVIGTYRPPPAEIRRVLLRWGEVEAAAQSATWGRIERQAVGTDGAWETFYGRGYAELAWARAADACTNATMRQGCGRGRAICEQGVGVVAVTTEAVGLPVARADQLPRAELRIDELLEAVAAAAGDGAQNGNLGNVSQNENRAENPIDIYRESCAILPPAGVTAEDVLARMPGVSLRTVQALIHKAVEEGRLVRTGAARATRYHLPAAVGARPVEVVTPAAVVAPTPAPAPATTMPAARPEVEKPKPTPRRDEPATRWLEVALAPERDPDEVLSISFYMDGPHAFSLGRETAWRQEVTPQLVPKLFRLASAEAKRMGQPPPPIDIVAGHTHAWYAATAG